MNPNKALVGKRRLYRDCRLMRHLEKQSSSSRVTRPLRVLDWGRRWTTAVPLARMGAEVVGIDIAKNLVDAGNKRARRRVSID